MIHPTGDVWPLFVGALLAYLLGSIPFGLVLTRLAGLGNLRSIGSGNIGATNVLRTGNKKLAALTLLLDGGKGALAVLAAATMGPDMAVVAMLGVAACSTSSNSASVNRLNRPRLSGSTIFRFASHGGTRGSGAVPDPRLAAGHQATNVRMMAQCD